VAMATASIDLSSSSVRGSAAVSGRLPANFSCSTAVAFSRRWSQSLKATISTFSLANSRRAPQ